MAAEKRTWLAVTAIWVGVIFFSSTSIAGESCERFYQFVLDTFFPSWTELSTGEHLLHLLAEKGVHFTLFFTLGFLASHLVRGSAFGRVVKVTIFGLIVGSSSEFLQSFFPDRDPAIRDVILNLVSATIGGMATIAWWRRRGSYNFR